MAITKSVYVKVCSLLAWLSARPLHAMSVVALLLAIVDTLIISLSWKAVALIGIAAIPWLAPLLKSLELPGVVKIELQDLEKLTEKAKEEGLISQPPKGKPAPSFVTIYQDDPNLALAGLRIEIEKRLRVLAKKSNTFLRKGTFLEMIKALEQKEIISHSEAMILRDLRGLLNQAVHGAEVSAAASDWSVNTGPMILAALDERAASLKKRARPRAARVRRESRQ